MGERALGLNDTAAESAGGRSSKDPRGTGDSQYSAPAAACAAQILVLLARSSEPQSIADMARETQSTKSLAFRVIRELERADLVHKQPDQRYQLGLASLELGAAVVARSDQAETTREALRSLSQETGQTVNLGVLRDFDVLFVMKQDAPSAVVTISYVGRRLPANCSALGRVLLSQLSTEDLLARLPDPLPRLTSKSPTDRDSFLEEVRQAHTHGFGTDYESAILGRAAIAVPITLPQLPGVPAALAVSASLDDLQDGHEHLLEALQRTRARIERASAARDTLHEMVDQEAAGTGI